jgi:hypothetical protein
MRLRSLMMGSEGQKKRELLRKQGVGKGRECTGQD